MRDVKHYPLAWARGASSKPHSGALRRTARVMRELCVRMTRMFSVEDRDAVRSRILEVASSDPRVVGGAEVGSLAYGGGDRWSDLDLTFAVADEVPVSDVLGDWTQGFVTELAAIHLFDLPSGATIYRVFLLPGCLQFDLSLTPASQFGAGGPKFRLLFGETVETPHAEPPSAQHLFGWAVAYARSARACIERRRWWQAEHYINAVRDHALALACRSRGLPARFGRGFDDLPPDVLAAFESPLVRSLEPDDLLRALRNAVDGLLREAAEVGEVAAKTEPLLRELLTTDRE